MTEPGGQMPRNVELSTEDGTVLRGRLYAQDGSPAPGIVMSHGFSGVKEQIEHYAVSFADAGFSVLVYDHRGFGESDGSPRLEVDPYRQISDWRDALSFMERRAEVDPAPGLGIWGSSFAGGLAMVIAANDARVRCVVCQIPNVSGHRNARQMFNVSQLRELRARFADDRTQRLEGGPPAMIPVFSTNPQELCALPPAVNQRFIDLSVEAAPTWRNEVTLRSVEHMIEFEPAGWTPHVAPKPLLMIIAAGDTCTFPEPQLEVFESAREPKKLVLHSAGHFQTYTSGFETTSQAARDWFLEHVGA